ncbi:MAG: CRISPR-associated protein Csx11 [Firmicutes bacterium]|nr:CRISPR-associated protein Csx11 [Bacillota bacterium]
MITALEIRGKARELSLPETTIQRDYAQNWLLKHMDAVGVVLKGGTGIRKAYIEDYRFSDDLDFTLLEERSLIDIKEAIAGAVEGAGEESGISFESDIVIKENINGFEGITRFRMLRPAVPPINIKIDLTLPSKEPILLEASRRAIIHPYSDDLGASVSCYSLEEIMAEKIRTVFERTRPRDIYDIVSLRALINMDDVLRALPEKLRTKGIEPDIEELMERRNNFAASWNNSLRHQIADLPSFNEVFETCIRFLEELEFTR